MRPYWLLYGEETWLVERGLAVLRSRLAGGGPDRAAVVWGDDDPERVTTALVDLETPSLFGPPGPLVLRRAEALPSAVEERVLALLPRLAAAAPLVLVARALDQRRRLHTACAKAGAAVGFPRVADTRAALAWVARFARERGRTIAPAAAEELVDRSGFDLARLADDVEKLGLGAAPGSTIGVQAVRDLVAPTRAHAVEELTDRLARRDLPGAMRALRLLMGAGEPPIRVVAFLAANLRRALHVSELLAAGCTEAEVAARLGMPPWLVGRSARRGTPAELERALDVLSVLDVDLKSSRPASAVFEQALLRIAGGAPRAGRSAAGPAAG